MQEAKSNTESTQSEHFIMQKSAAGFSYAVL